MNNFRHVKIELLIFKTLLYRFCSFGIMACLLWIFTKDIKQALQFSVILESLKLGWYLLYEYIFNKKYKVTKDDGAVVWFTGIPCSGKSTIADAVAEKLKKMDRRYERLDGDIVRTYLCSDLGFSKEDRKENLKRIGFVSSLLSRNGTVVLCSFVSPYAKDRQNIRNMTTNFIEVYVDASPIMCMERDVKGMWKQAQRGEIKGFTGYDAPYYKPKNPEIVCQTGYETIEESANKVIKYLKKKSLI